MNKTEKNTFDIGLTFSWDIKVKLISIKIKMHEDMLNSAPSCGLHIVKL